MHSLKSHRAFHSIRSLSSLCFSLAFGACLIGCSSMPKATATVEQLIEAEKPVNEEIKALNEKVFASVTSGPKVRDYLISEGDLLQITFFETKELNTEARVGARGAISLPLVGQLQASGLTIKEAEQKIEDLYGQDYLEHPHVNIFIKEQMGMQVTVLGSVNKAGTYGSPARIRLLDALSLAGGLSDKAGRLVQLRRTEDDPDQAETFLVDLDELVKGGRVELNLTVRGGDVIFVPEAGTFYLDGAVNKPGNYPIRKDMTIEEAIVLAGGFKATAKTNDIKLLRYQGKGQRDIVQLNIKELREGPAQELALKDRDIIFVETNVGKALLYGLRLGFGTGLVSMGYSPAEMPIAPTSRY